MIYIFFDSVKCEKSKQPPLTPTRFVQFKFLIYRNLSKFKHLFGEIQELYSPTILKNIPCLILQFFLYREAFECNTISDWLNHTVYPIRSCVTFQFANLGEIDKDYSGGWLVNTGPRIVGLLQT